MITKGRFSIAMFQRKPCWSIPPLAFPQTCSNQPPPVQPSHPIIFMCWFDSFNLFFVDLTYCCCFNLFNLFFVHLTYLTASLLQFSHHILSCCKTDTFFLTRHHLLFFVSFWQPKIQFITSYHCKTAIFCWFDSSPEHLGYT